MFLGVSYKATLMRRQQVAVSRYMIETTHESKEYVKLAEWVRPQGYFPILFILQHKKFQTRGER